MFIDEFEFTADICNGLNRACGEVTEEGNCSIESNISRDRFKPDNVEGVNEVNSGVAAERKVERRLDIFCKDDKQTAS